MHYYCDCWNFKGGQSRSNLEFGFEGEEGKLGFQRRRRNRGRGSELSEWVMGGGGKERNEITKALFVAKFLSFLERETTREKAPSFSSISSHFYATLCKNCIVFSSLSLYLSPRSLSLSSDMWSETWGQLSWFWIHALLGWLSSTHSFTGLTLTQSVTLSRAVVLYCKYVSTF